MTLLVNAVTFLLLVVVFAVWAVVGFVFWIPLLTRAVLVFAASVVHAVITGQRASGLRDYLRDASSFWFEGFQIAKQTLYPPSGEPSEWKLEIRIGRVLAESVWTAAYWGVIYCLFHLRAARLFVPVAAKRIRDTAIAFGPWANGLGHDKLVLLVVGAFFLGAAIGVAVVSLLRHAVTSRHEEDEEEFVEEHELPDAMMQPEQVMR